MNKSAFRQTLQDAFSEEELITLCFDLGLDYNNLPGDTKSTKITELIAHFNRRSEAKKLMGMVFSHRPELFEIMGQPQNRITTGKLGPMPPVPVAAQVNGDAGYYKWQQLIAFETHRGLGRLRIIVAVIATLQILDVLAAVLGLYN